MPQITYSANFTFNPNLPLRINYDKASPVPADVVLQMAMSFFRTSGGSGGALGDYDEFFLRLIINPTFVNGQAVNAINFSGDLINAPNQELQVFKGLPTLSDINLNFDNLSNIPNGTYDTNMSFVLSGRKYDDEHLSILDGIMATITVSITGSGGPVEPLGIEPENLTFTHVFNTPLPPGQDVRVDSQGAFKVSVYGPIELWGPSLEFVGTVRGVREYAGAAAQTLVVTLAPEAMDLGAGAHEVILSFEQARSNPFFIGALTVSLYLFETTDFIIDPAALEFFAIKDIQEASSQIVNVTGSRSFTMVRPSWLTAVSDSNVGFGQVVVKPNNNLDVGTYEGDIVINDGTDNYLISVIHNVYGNVQLGLSTTKINFTDDYDAISRFYEQINYKLLLNLAVDYYNYGATLLNHTELPYVLGFFNLRTKFFVGQTLNGVMKELLDLKSIRMDSLTDSSDALRPFRNYYQPASVDITTLFKHDFNEALDKTFNYNDVKFIKGRRPKTQFDDTFILDYYRDPLRVTVNSVAMFNFYKEKNHLLRIYKNGTFERSISHAVGAQRIFGYKLDFSNYAPGDVVEMRLYKNLDGTSNEAWFENPDNYIAQQYILIPEGKESHHIGYEDEHGLLKIIEFTGNFKFENGYENLIAKNYDDFLETSKKLDVKKTRKAIINTGFIFKVNTKNIDALLSSKRAWLLSKENKKSIAMVPVTKAMSDIDTNQDLYSYDVEFEINFNNDFEINT